mmetsp:Transcript_41511/g.129100  ORF Transcript_41511/g.129100 Transcript_41511/m.129100 type:complete len:355 (-) Transcript_41511:199-1263(-)
MEARRRLATVAGHALAAQPTAEQQRKQSSAEEMSTSRMARSLSRPGVRRASEAPPPSGTRWNERASTLGGGGSLRGKTLFVCGGSRGIGFCIAKTAARDGANVVIAAKTAEPHPTLPGTIYTAAEECERLGGQGLACIVDVRDEASIEAAVAATVRKFGGIDILINCASAIFPQPTEKMNAKRFDLMFEVGPRGSMLTAKHCIPHLKASAAKGNNPHILNLSPPLPVGNLSGTPNYMINKLGMTIAAMGHAEELKGRVAANTLWPTGLIATSALNHMMNNDPMKIDEMMQAGRTPQIQADAAYAILTSDSKMFTGNMTIDEEVLRKAGVNDFAQYDYISMGATPEERLKNILAN